MRTLAILRLRPPPSLLSRSFSHSLKKSSEITEEDLTQINLLIPRLCESNHLKEAVRLLVTSLLLNPPLASLPFSLLINRLSLHPETGPPFSLLTALHRTGPHCHYALPLTTRLLITSYLNNRRYKEALKVFDWMSRPESPCRPDNATFRVLVSGLCWGGKTLEMVRVLREMVGAGFEVGPDLQTSVVRGLLREARVREAREVSEALGRIGDGEDGVRGALELIDRMVRDSDWRV